MVSPALETDLRALHPANESESFGTYLAGLWRRRDYVWYVAANDVRRMQMNTVLGNLWHLLNPLIQMAIYFVVFGVVIGTDRGVDNFVCFLACGIFLFQFTVRSTSAGAGAIVKNLGLLRTMSFPRAILPLTSTTTQLIVTLPSILVLYVIALVTGETPHWKWLGIPLLIAAQFVFNMGAAFVAARATAQFRDVERLLPFMFRILFYSSGVIFKVDEFIADRGWQWLFNLNPMYGLISTARWMVLGTDVEPWAVVAFFAWTLVLFVGGFWWFHRSEAVYGRD